MGILISRVYWFRKGHHYISKGIHSGSFEGCLFWPLSQPILSRPYFLHSVDYNIMTLPLIRIQFHSFHLSSLVALHRLFVRRPCEE